MHFPYTSKVMFWKLWYLKKADLIILLTNLSQLSFAAPTNPILCLFTFVNILNGCFFVCNELKLAVHHLRCLTGISFNCWSPKNYLSHFILIQVWSLETGACLTTLQGHLNSVTCLQFNRDRIISGSLDCTLKFWNLSDGSVSWILDWAAGLTY